ncbi:MAG: HAD-IA family hydrolase, partial [Ilumatobacter sp.]
MTRTDDTTTSSLDSSEAAPDSPAFPAAVLWDMDGTLVDTEPYWFSSERDLVDRHGHGDWPDEHAHAMIGFDLMDSAAYMQEHGGVDLPAEEIVEKLLDGVIARLHRRIPWQPGARELLADLNAAGVPCALVTMSWRRFADPVLAALPTGSFVASITGDEVPPGRGKPHPDPYLLGADACGVAPGECVAIEDSPTGVRSALAAGCRVLGVPNVKALRREPGLTIIESLDGVTPGDLGDLMLAPAATPRKHRAAGRRGLVLGVLALTVAALVWFTTQRSDPEPAIPPGAIAIDVWAPYWTLSDTLPEVETRLDDAREVSPFWFAARGVDEIATNQYASPERTDQFLAAVASSGGGLVPSIQDEMPAGEMAAVLADPVTRRRHVDAIVAFADDLDADGIDLDYEQFAFADGRDTWASTRPNWVAFVTELAGALHADDRTLTVSIPPVWGLADDADV